MFSIEEQECKMHITPRSERNGEEVVPAATLKLSFPAPNDILAEFSPDLKSSLYKRPNLAEADMADKADTRMDDPNYLPSLKFPKMKNTLSFEVNVVGATTTVDFGLGGDSNLILEDCVVDGFKLDPQEGGTVFVSFNVACHPTRDQYGDLCMMQDQLGVFTISPPTSPQMELKEAA